MLANAPGMMSRGLIESGLILSRRSARARRARTARRERGLGLRLCSARSRRSCAASDGLRAAAHFEREQHLAPGRLVERGLELVRVRLVGEMPVRRGQRERQRVAGDRSQLGLRRELRGDPRQLERGDERRPCAGPWAAATVARVAACRCADARCGVRRDAAESVRARARAGAAFVAAATQCRGARARARRKRFAASPLAAPARTPAGAAASSKIRSPRQAPAPDRRGPARRSGRRAGRSPAASSAANAAMRGPRRHRLGGRRHRLRDRHPMKQRRQLLERRRRARPLRCHRIGLRQQRAPSRRPSASTIRYT